MTIDSDEEQAYIPDADGGLGSKFLLRLLMVKSDRVCLITPGGIIMVMNQAPRTVHIGLNIKLNLQNQCRYFTVIVENGINELCYA
jgi:hypothetical protein